MFNSAYYPDKTLYFFDTRSDADYSNLLDINLDAVFHPLILSHPEIFLQEGWRYESDDKGMHYQGVVLTEIEGEAWTADTVLEEELIKLLFPDTCYCNDQGGIPERLLDLSYDRIVALHDAYYHPSNARIVLYGSVDIYSALKILNSYLKEYDRRDCDFRIPMQQPIVSKASVTSYEVTPDEALKNHAVIACGTVIGTFADRERYLAVSLLSDYLAGDGEAPLLRAVLDAKIAEQFCFTSYDFLQQPVMYWTATNTGKNQLPVLYATIQKTLTDIVEQGTDPERMEACWQRLAFRLRNPDEGSLLGPIPRSMKDAIAVFNTWLYDGDPADALLTEEPLKALREKLHTGFFEQLIRELLLENPHTATVLLVPSHTIRSEKEKEERQRLEREVAEWTESDRLKNKEAIEAMYKRQDTPEPSEELAKLPLLRISDLNEHPAPILCELTQKDDVPILRHALNSPISHFSAYFAANDIPAEDLPAFSLMCSFLGKLPTARHSSKELSLAVKKTIGDLKITPVSISGTAADRCRIMMGVTATCIKERAANMAALLGEILTETIWNDEKTVRETLNQLLINTKAMMLRNAWAYASRRVLASQTAEGLADEYLHGYTLVKAIEGVISQGSYRYLQEKMHRLAERVVTKLRLTLSCSEAVPETAAAVFLRVLPAFGIPCETEKILKPLPIRQEGIVIPYDSCFLSVGAALKRFHKQFTGSLDVLSRLVYSDLYENMRQKGWVYHSQMLANMENILLFTQRDSQPTRSLDEIRKMPTRIRAAMKDSPDLTGQIISGAGTFLNRYRTTEQKMSVAEERWFKGISEEEVNEQYQQLLATTPEDIISLCDMLDEMLAENAFCVVGGQDVLASFGNSIQII